MKNDEVDVDLNACAGTLLLPWRSWLAYLRRQGILIGRLLLRMRRQNGDRRESDTCN